jgi:hypothetical protein
MRLMMMHKNDPFTEAGEKPPAELMAKMGQYIGEHAQRGTFLDGQGLGRSATRTRLTFRDGRATIKHGPYKGEHELPAAALLLTVRTRDEAIGWAERYGKIVGEGEIELGPINEPWDLGMMPKPADPPLRVLMLDNADEARPRTAKQKADLTRLKTEMTKAGVLSTDLALKPSSTAKRLVFTNHQLRMSDGPFAEAKELIGGYAVLELPSVDAAVEEAKRYAEILGGTLELEIRVIGDSIDDSI